jgi:LacI family transcriptional regulator
LTLDSFIIIIRITISYYYFVLQTKAFYHMSHSRAASQRKPTQYDVAREAGVSQTTVSLVLNNPDILAVPGETRQKVFEAIKKLGYVPNSTARMLRTNRTNTLACIIPMITNPFYPAFVSGIQDAAEKQGYEVITYNTHGNAEKEAKFLQSVQQGRADGVIGVFFYMRARDLFPLLEKNIPVVRLETHRQRTGEWPLDNIYVDNASAAFTATDYLISKGHRRIAMITGPGGPRNARREGYLQALSRHNNGLESLIEEVSSYDEIGGYQGMQRLIESGQPPQAVFAANDLMAIGVMQAILDAGLSVPDDIAVVGFDDIPAARLVTPGLTTIRQSQEVMGCKAAELLLERLSGKETGDGRVIEMPFELIIRNSA